MEAVVLCGVQGSGKTTLYRDRFLDSHVRVSMDLMRTRHREAGFKVVAYLVEIDEVEALARNAERGPRRRVPAAGLVGTGRRLQRPTAEEGFDELWHATAARDG